MKTPKELIFKINPEKTSKKPKKSEKMLLFSVFFVKKILKKSLMGVNYFSYFEFTDLIPPVSYMETRGCHSEMVAIIFIS
jgi:hypothetical protein